MRCAKCESENIVLNGLNCRQEDLKYIETCLEKDAQVYNSHNSQQLSTKLR